MQLTRPLYNLFRNERCGATYRKYLVAETSRKHRTDLNAVIAEALALLPEGLVDASHPDTPAATVAAPSPPSEE